MAVYRADRPINGLHGNDIFVQERYLDDWHKLDEFGLGSLVHRKFTDAARRLNHGVMACFGLMGRMARYVVVMGTLKHKSR